MCNENLLDNLWNQLNAHAAYNTPDNIRQTEFTIQAINQNPDSITISPQNITISKQAFLAALSHLTGNHHTQGNPCQIRSSNTPKKAGPLCQAARKVNNNVRCINYILPILAAAGIVGINGKRPNTTWLMQNP